MNFLRTLLNCCAGFRFYRDLLPLSPLRSVRFLAGVIFLLVLVQIGTFVPVLWQTVDTGADWVQDNLPRFEIHNGQARYDSPEPFVYTNEVASIVVNTSGQTNRTDYARPLSLVIEQKRICIGFAYEGRDGRLVRTQESQVPLVGYPNGTVNGDYIRQLRAPWLLWITPFLLVLSFLVWMLAVLIQAYIFTMVISFAESTTLRKFGFDQFFNIAAHACVPAAIVATTLIVSRMYDVQWLLMAFLVTYFVYVMGATAACRQEEEP